MNILLLSNQDLSDAIGQTFGFLREMMNNSKPYETTFSHYKNLLEERSRRAGERVSNGIDTHEDGVIIAMCHECKSMAGRYNEIEHEKSCSKNAQKTQSDAGSV